MFPCVGVKLAFRYKVIQRIKHKHPKTCLLNAFNVGIILIIVESIKILQFLIIRVTGFIFKEWKIAILNSFISLKDFGGNNIFHEKSPTLYIRKKWTKIEQKRKKIKCI